ncbi:hypothetical protein [Protaetiibacter mangrovi]|uniref:PKD domain-containing protein n=1 Tax=Protaetiibacter mangrovi TaxID=2970926 RepID=A0ABT1ZIN7_9MICO|nr:hypothetical protein [Protaetiibacter mangrovi]MCS0500576.1 hypothetical protein [Protaetiibacter mangrovi]TPW91513.1 hypothetical protein FJ656_35805 [Schumannella luteola]
MEFDLGHCSIGASIDDDAAVLDGSATDTDGSGTSTPGSGTPGGGGGTPADPATCTRVDPSTLGCAPRDDFDVTVITLADIARFRPAPGVQRMEPDGWVVVGLPANIYSIVDRQVVAGTLLGQPADVRFTPVAWRWDYGDGSGATLATKGGTWAALGLREFDATPTSHVYRLGDDYTIRLSIVYHAEYRMSGGAFTPIAGTLTLPANELRITAGGAKTVLVDRDCTVAPHGPGC